MKTLLKMKVAIITVLSALFLSACVVPYTTSTVEAHPRYVNPNWAPEYHQGCRYYYFPDIEVYYDLSNGDFIFLDNGRWYFSRELPRYYARFDLNTAFVVTLNVSVFQPWRHHQYYVSHYPRYYYRTVYRDRDYRYIRGFNENVRKPIYHKGYEASEGRRGNGYENRSTRNDNGRSTRNDDPRSGQDNGRQRVDNQPATTTEPAVGTQDGRSERGGNYTREPENTNYYGRRIGQPVKVERQMRETKPAPARETKRTEAKPETKSEGRSSGGRR